MKRLNQDGGVSLITVAIFMTIVTIVIMSYLYTALNHQKNSLTFDMNNQAYYAAESGVQDAIRYLNANPTSPYRTTGKTDCSPFIGGTGTLYENLGYTCQLIDANASTGISGNTKNGTVTTRIDPQSINPSLTYLMRVRWSLRSDPSSVGYVPLVPRIDNVNDQLFPPQAQWTQSGVAIHPLLRATLIVVPKNTTFNKNDVKQKVFFLSPTKERPSIYVDALDFNTPQTQESVVQTSECFTNSSLEPYDPGIDHGGYACQRSIRVSGAMLASSEFYLRLSSQYGSTDFNIGLLQFNLSTGQPTGPEINLLNSQAVIDVTGRAGNVYRRVKQSVSIGNGYLVDQLPDAALVAGDGICKYFSLGTIPESYHSRCNPTAPPY